MAVLVTTSVGEFVIDLFTEKCPLASKNFLKLCKIKYYNNCLFHDVQKNFIAQTGDPTATGHGGDSIYKFLYGDQARFFDDELHPNMKHDRVGVVAMANAGTENTNASQFYIALRGGLDSLDGKHTIFGEIGEGIEVIEKFNDAYVDEKNRPYKNIRVKRMAVLDDPFEDPPGLAELIPDRSPELKVEEGDDVRLDDDWVPMDEQRDPEEVEKIISEKEAHSRAVVLEMIGDIPEAEMKPPENVLFVCKLNPVTEDGDLEVLFSRFGKVVSADIIRDHKTNDSLCYGFVEFETQEACEAAYFKMDNVLLDDRRIHVDFSQSVAKLWNRYQKFGTKDEKEDPTKARPRYELKETDGQRGGTGKTYDMVFDHEHHGGDDKRNGSDRRHTEHSSQAEVRTRDGREERERDTRTRDNGDERARDTRVERARDTKTRDTRDEGARDTKTRDERERDSRTRDTRDERERDSTRDERERDSRARDTRDERRGGARDRREETWSRDNRNEKNSREERAKNREIGDHSAQQKEHRSHDREERDDVSRKRSREEERESSRKDRRSDRDGGRWEKDHSRSADRYDRRQDRHRDNNHRESSTGVTQAKAVACCTFVLKRDSCCYTREFRTVLLS